MGADIYLKKVYDANHDLYYPKFTAEAELRDQARARGDLEAAEKHQVEVSRLYDLLQARGYFRDSYNDSSLIWLLDMSWWGSFEQWFDEEGDLPPENMPEVIALIDKQFTTVFAGNFAAKFGEHPDRDRWLEYFKGKYERFTALVREAIELNEPLHFSC